MIIVQNKTCPVLPDDVTIMILNQLGYNTLDLNRLGSHARMGSRIWDEKVCSSMRFRVSSLFDVRLVLACLSFIDTPACHHYDVTFFRIHGHSRMRDRVWVCITVISYILLISLYCESAQFEDGRE